MELQKVNLSVPTLVLISYVTKITMTFLKDLGMTHNIYRMENLFEFHGRHFSVSQEHLPELLRHESIQWSTELGSFGILTALNPVIESGKYQTE